MSDDAGRERARADPSYAEARMSCAELVDVMLLYDLTNSCNIANE